MFARPGFWQERLDIVSREVNRFCCADGRGKMVWKLNLLGRGGIAKFPHQLTVACPVFTFFVISTGCFIAVAVLL